MSQKPSLDLDHGFMKDIRRRLEKRAKEDGLQPSAPDIGYSVDTASRSGLHQLRAMQSVPDTELSQKPSLNLEHGHLKYVRRQLQKRTEEDTLQPLKPAVGCTKNSGDATCLQHSAAQTGMPSDIPSIIPSDHRFMHKILISMVADFGDHVEIMHPFMPIFVRWIIMPHPGCIKR